jgi:cytidine deaminase
MKDETSGDTEWRAAVEAARAFIRTRQRGDWHSVAAVVLTASGRRHLAVNLDSTLPRASICAEPVAIGMAMAADPDDPVVFCGAVNRRGEVIPPCGPCRELMLDYAAGARVAVPEGADMGFRPLAELMPTAYKHGKRKT